jgi:intracellular multiplication protein IcmE
MKNQKIKISFFRNAKVRLMIAAVAVVGIAATGVALWQASIKREALVSSMNVGRAPDIQSIPGAGNPTMEYVKQQDRDNVKNAQQARDDGTSSVPTINRGSFVGSIDTFGQLGAAPSQCPIDPSTLPAVDPKSCTVDSLQRARDSGVRALELRCKGCTCPSLKMAGYTVGDLKEAGLDAKSLRDCGFGLAELKAAGFSAADLKAAGFTAAELKAAGFTAAELKDAGFTAAELKDAGFSAKELKDAGFTAAELKDAGFTAKQLKDAGFSAADLKAAGFTAADLAAAGYSGDELKAAGFSDQDIQKAGLRASLSSSVCNPEELKKARQAGVSAQALKARGCGVAALKAAGYSAAELRAAGFSAKDLKDAGFSAKALKDAGFSAAELKAAGFSAAELKDAGFSAKDLKDAGFSAKELKDAGFSAKALKDAGFSAAELKAAGFSAGQLKDAGFSAAELKAAGFSDDALRAAGFSAEQLKEAGVDPSALALAGYTKGDLLRAGFTPIEAGYVTPPPATPANPPAIAQTVDPTTAASAFMPKINNNSPSDQLAELERQQALRMSRQQRQDMILQQQGAMAMQAQKLMVGWSNFNIQTAQAATPDVVPAGGGMGGSAMGMSGASAQGGDVVKAGDIMFAVLDTSINTDEKNTPIMARIVGGPYKGGKLIGRFTLTDKRVMLSFNLLNLPDRGKSVPINAVAIDPETARTAMSGEVDNHYLLRYGTLFASSFISGVGSALQTAGSTTQTTAIGTVTTTKPLNATQLTIVGAGDVGRKIGDALAPTFNMPPTVTIQSGTGMGLLFMSDANIPTANQ